MGVIGVMDLCWVNEMSGSKELRTHLQAMSISSGSHFTACFHNACGVGQNSLSGIKIEVDWQILLLFPYS